MAHVSLGQDIGLYGQEAIVGTQSSWWQDLMKWGTGLTSDILKAQYGQPVYPPGTVITTTPQGQQVIRQAQGLPVPAYTAAAGGSIGVGGEGFSTVLLLGGIALVAVIAISASRK